MGDRVFDFLTACWFGVVGACIGSFLNVVAYRMPRRISIVWKPSHCPACGHAIRAYDNVPVLGWLWLRGQCRDCGVAISPRYAIVEAVMGATWFALAYVEVFSAAGNLPAGPIASPTGAWNTVWNPYWPLIGVYAFHAALLCLLMCASLISLDDEFVPYRIAAFGVIVLIAAVVAWRLDPTLPMPCTGGAHAGSDAAVGLAAGVAIALAASQCAARREFVECEFRRRNLGFALGMTGGYLGVESTLIILTWAVATAAATRFALRRPAQDFYRIIPSYIFAASVLYLAIWRHIHELLAR